MINIWTRSSGIYAGLLIQGILYHRNSINHSFVPETFTEILLCAGFYNWFRMVVEGKVGDTNMNKTQARPPGAHLLLEKADTDNDAMVGMAGKDVWDARRFS